MPEANFERARVIGEKLRAARQQRQMSLRDLAKRADISASMLSQIETGKAYPSVRSIYNIAAALNLPVDYFFPEPENNSLAQPEENGTQAGQMTASEMREVTLGRLADFNGTEFAPRRGVIAQVVHASARPTILLKGGVSWARLTATAEADAEFLEVTYSCGASSGENMSQHEGREFGLILEGELIVHLGGQRITLGAGDSIVFDSTTPHRLANEGVQPMRALWVVWNRR